MCQHRSSFSHLAVINSVTSFPCFLFKIPDIPCPPNLLQAPEPPQETKEAKQTVAEVKVDINGNENQNVHPDVEEKKKKLNKRERKEARQQKNGKAAKGAEKTIAQEPEEEQSGKKKKKDRKRKHEEDGDEEQNGHSAENETSGKKKKTGKSVLYRFNQDLFLNAGKCGMA